MEELRPGRYLRPSPSLAKTGSPHRQDYGHDYRSEEMHRGISARLGECWYKVGQECPMKLTRLGSFKYFGRKFPVSRTQNACHLVVAPLHLCSRSIYLPYSDAESSKPHYSETLCSNIQPRRMSRGARNRSIVHSIQHVILCRSSSGLRHNTPMYLHVAWYI